MLAAIATVHGPVGFFMNWDGMQKGEGFEYHLLVLAITGFLMIRGGGAFPSIARSQRLRLRTWRIQAGLAHEPPRVNQEAPPLWCVLGGSYRALNLSEGGDQAIFSHLYPLTAAVLGGAALRRVAEPQTKREAGPPGRRITR